MRVFIAALIILLSPKAFGQASDQILALQQAQIEKIRQQLLPVGTVLTSFLPWEAFQKEAGGKWVPCDGVTSVQNTSFGRLTGRTVAPDCRGRFLRAVGGRAAALGELQADTLKSHTHSADVDISHRHGNLGYTLFDINVTWTPGNDSNHAVLKRTSPNNVFDTNYTARRTVNVQAQGSDETRPTNISVAVYIKVD